MSDVVPDRRSLLTTLVMGVAGARSFGRPNQQAEGQAAGAFSWVEEFGAVGDGQVDDTEAFVRGMASTGELRLQAGKSYRVTRSLVFTRPVAISGGTKEQTRLLFDDGAYPRVGGAAAALVIPHEHTLASEPGSDARRTSLSGFTVQWVGASSTRVHGCLISAPAYVEAVDVLGFPLDGFRVEASTEQISGNANGTTFFNSSAISNGRNGFAFHGNDANACVLLGARAFDNAGAGFYDGSLLGNTYIATEVAGNHGGGYASVKTTPNRSVFLGCYAEPDQLYDLNHRNIVIGALGHINGLRGSVMRALPSGDLFILGGQVFGASEEATPGANSTEAYLRVSPEGIDLRHADGHRVRLSKLLSSNYVDILNGDQPLIRFPMHEVSGNVSDARPWLPSGLTIGAGGRSGFVGAGVRPPNEGKFRAGALWLNEAPQSGGYVGWICVESGDPGNWRPFGKID